MFCVQGALPPLEVGVLFFDFLCIWHRLFGLLSQNIYIYIYYKDTHPIYIYISHNHCICLTKFLQVFGI